MSGVNCSDSLYEINHLNISPVFYVTIYRWTTKKFLVSNGLAFKSDLLVVVAPDKKVVGGERV